MLHTLHEFDQLFTLAVDRHFSLLADAAAYRLLADAPAPAGPLRRLGWALGDLLLLAGGQLTAGRPHAATVRSSSI